MHLFVAFGTQRDQVLFLVPAGLAAELEVMHLQLLHAAAELAAPTVALQYLAMQRAISRRIKPESWGPGADGVHEAFRTTSH